MAGEKNALFRDAALARLASPEQLDTRLDLPGYPRALLVALAVALVAAALFAAWLLASK